MAVKKSAGVAKAKTAPAAKAAPKKAAPKKAAVTAAPKKAAPKKAAAPKLTPPQRVMLEKIGGHTDPVGYTGEKKELKMIEALLKHKVVKKGKKGEKGFAIHISNAGKKVLSTPAPAPKA